MGVLGQIEKGRIKSLYIMAMVAIVYNTHMEASLKRPWNVENLRRYYP